MADKHYTSIQDFLVSEGFAIGRDDQGSYFFRANFTIRAEELVGHTIQSFTEKAKKNGWLEKVEETGYLGMYTNGFPLYQLD